MAQRQILSSYVECIIICLYHHRHQILKTRRGFPTHLMLCLGWVTETCIDLNGSVKRLVDTHYELPLPMSLGVFTFALPHERHIKGGGGRIYEVFDRVRHARGYYKIIWGFLHQHEIHRLDVIACKAPIALGLKITELERLYAAVFDCSKTPRDFARDILRLAPGRLMVKKDARTHKDAATLAIGNHKIFMSSHFGLGIGTHGIKGGALVLCRGCIAEDFARGSLKNFNRWVDPHCFVNYPA